MVLTENEAWLLARGYSFYKENIRIPIKRFKIWNDDFIDKTLIVKIANENVSNFNSKQAI